ncbi:hypothetical protein IG631_02116 [Alternaria alternata]|nr:hypothetical protein IG631_02116 [Alternaria alternata]
MHTSTVGWKRWHIAVHEVILPKHCFFPERTPGLSRTLKPDPVSLVRAACVVATGSQRTGQTRSGCPLASSQYHKRSGRDGASASHRCLS